MKSRRLGYRINNDSIKDTSDSNSNSHPPSHTGDIIINISTDIKNEQIIRDKIRQMKGVKEIIDVNIGDANINVFTDWTKEDALKKLKQIRRFNGVLNARAKLLLSA